MIGRTLILVALVVAVAASTCLAGELSGAQTYGIRMDAGEWVASSGMTLDYELAKDLFITLDLRTDYQWRAQSASRIELSANYYPTFWLLRSWCVSAGGVYRTREGPMFFVEISRPFEWPPAWLRTIWSWVR